MASPRSGEAAWFDYLAAPSSVPRSAIATAAGGLQFGHEDRVPTFGDWPVAAPAVLRTAFSSTLVDPAAPTPVFSPASNCTPGRAFDAWAATLYTKLE
jgi:hypothetical protein